MRYPVLAALLLALVLATAGAPAAADGRGAANVEAVEVTRTGADTFRFDVTIASEETGWDAYADAFEIVAPDGEVLGTRTLHHPHVNEQPFTRSLRGVEIPPGIDSVTVRAHHSRDGYDGLTRSLELPR